MRQRKPVGADAPTFPDDLERLRQGALEREGFLPERKYRSQTYEGLDVASFLRDVGVRRVRVSGDWVTFRCPFHDDRNPSAGMHRTRTTWRCHACGVGGNAAVFLGMLKKVSTRQAHARLVARRYHDEVPEATGYVRKEPGRASGATAEIHEQLGKATELLRRGASYAETVRALKELFGISESTAKRRIRAARAWSAGDMRKLGAREIHALVNPATGELLW
jgi:CHC2 zinc finger